MKKVVRRKTAKKKTTKKKVSKKLIKKRTLEEVKTKENELEKVILRMDDFQRDVYFIDAIMAQ